MTLDISREQFRAYADGNRPVVIRTTAELDIDIDPLSAYAALSGRTSDGSERDYTFLLESAEKVASSDPDGAFAAETDDRHARFSFVGYDPRAVVTVSGDESDIDVLDDRYRDLVSAEGDDVVDSLRAAMPETRLCGFPETDRQQLNGGLVGFLAYDAVYDLWLDEVGVDRPDSRFPDAQFVLTTTTVRFDHATGDIELVCTPVIREEDDVGARYDALEHEVERVGQSLADAEPLSTGGFVREGEIAGPQDTYEDAVERAKEYVLSGDIYQGVISRTRELYGDVDPLGLYESLRAVNPSPYMYLLGYDDLTIVGASPETLVSVAGDRIVSNPIAGTCPRGNSPVEDRRLAGEMLADGKERAEHTMLVDLARNDVRRVAKAGSVRVEEFMNVLKYSHVQHIESTVTGTMAVDADAFDAARATFPAGTLSGAPKIRAMEIIDELESSPRGPYGGGVGYFDWGGDTDFAIVIRSATVETDTRLPDDSGDWRGDRITVQAGAGIVADSDPESEYIETEQKMDGVLTAVERIETGDDPVAQTEGDQ